jgi:hypothetical protein
MIMATREARRAQVGPPTDRYISEPTYLAPIC